MALKLYRYGFVAILAMLATGALGAWVNDPSGEKRTAREMTEKAELQALERRAAEATANTSQMNKLLNRDKEVSPVLTLKNYKDGKDISIQCSEGNSAVNCRAVK